MTTILWIAGIGFGLLLLAYVALVISFVERKDRRAVSEQVFRSGPSEDTPMAEQEASSAHSIAMIIRSEFRFKPPEDLDVDAVAAILAIGMPHTAPLAAWCHEARKRIDPAIAPYVQHSWWEKTRRWLRRHGI